MFVVVVKMQCFVMEIIIKEGVMMIMIMIVVRRGNDSTDNDPMVVSNG